MNGLWQKLRQTGGDRTGKILFWVGIAGLVLIGLTEILPGKDTAATTASEVTEMQVEAALEQRMTDLLTQVDGVGRCRVMVTLESGSRSVYATDSAVTASGNSQQVLTVDTDTGPVGLLLTRIQPTVKGVAVVCDGGGDPAVCRRITQLIATTFHISERRVCIAKQK